MVIEAPINFKKWIEDNRERLKPPVCNQVVYKDKDFIVMVVGGPNQRKDYHFNEGEEFFYQLEGDMVLRIVEDGQARDINIREGEIFLLPPRVPHSPQRFESTVGLVIERVRKEGELDGFMWFCEGCHGKLYEEFLQLRSIVDDLPPVFKRFWSSSDHTACKKCGETLCES